MLNKQTPESVECFRGPLTEFREEHCVASISRHSVQMQPKNYHTDIEFVAPSNHKRRYIQLISLQEKFKGTLSNRKKHSNLYRNPNSGRLIRKEFANLIAHGSAAILHYYDVMTGEIGFLKNGTFLNISYKTLAKAINSSEARIKKLFRHLKSIGYARVGRCAKKDSKGRIRGVSAKKTITSSFIIDTFGIKAWKSISRLKEKLISSGRKIVQKANNFTNRVLRSKSAVKKTYVESDYVPTKAQSKPNLQKALDLYKIDPSKTLTEYLELLLNPL